MGSVFDQSDVVGWLTQDLYHLIPGILVTALVMGLVTLVVRWLCDACVDLSVERLVRSAKVWPQSAERAAEVGRGVGMLGVWAAWAGAGWLFFAEYHSVSSMDVAAWLAAGAAAGFVLGAVVGRLRLTRLARWALV